MFAANASVNARILGQRIANKNSRIINLLLCLNWDRRFYLSVQKKMYASMFPSTFKYYLEIKVTSSEPFLLSVVMTYAQASQKRKAFWWEKKMCTSFMLNNNTTSLDCRKWLASHSQNKRGKLQNNSMEDQSVTSRLCNSTFAGSTLSLNSHLSKERRTSTVIFHWLFTLQDKFSCQFLVSQ